MEFRVLGSLEVCADGIEVTPSAPKLRGILAFLVFRHNQVLPVSTLIDELWGEDPPRSALSTLQTYMYKLRKMLDAAGGAGVLVTKPTGYLAAIPPEGIDVWRFERQLAEGRLALDEGDVVQASEILSGALNMWRGPVLADVTAGERLSAHVTRVEESRLGALELRLDADLRLGRHHELVSELKELTLTHRLTEGFHAMLMVALHRSGRRIEALDTYQLFRNALVEELGVEPGPVLRELQSALLSDDPLPWHPAEPGRASPPGLAAAGLAAPGPVPPGLMPAAPGPPGMTPPGLAAPAMTPPSLAALGLVGSDLGPAQRPEAGPADGGRDTRATLRPGRGAAAIPVHNLPAPPVNGLCPEPEPEQGPAGGRDSGFIPGLAGVQHPALVTTPALVLAGGPPGPAAGYSGLGANPSGPAARAVVPKLAAALADRPAGGPDGPVAGPGGGGFSTPAQLPRDISDFAGRAEVVSTVARMLASRDTQDGTARGVVVAGMPGVGKSVLAVRAAHQARGAFPDGQLFADLGSSRSDPADPAAVLGDFLWAAGIPGLQVPPALAERSKLFRSWTAGRHMLIVLDDAMSGSQVQPLLPADTGCRVLVTSRRSMTELAGVYPVELSPMDCGEGLELLGNMVGRPRLSRDVAAAREIVRLCDGLPLAIRAAGTMLTSAHAWPLAKMAARLGGSNALLDELSLCGFDILGSFEPSYRWLPAPDQGVFRLLSLLGDREFTAAWAALLLGCDPAAAQAHLARLVECHLLGLGCQDPSGEIHYRFHDLARIYARARLGDVLDPGLAAPAGHLASRSRHGVQPRIA